MGLERFRPPVGSFSVRGSSPTGLIKVSKNSKIVIFLDFVSDFFGFVDSRHPARDPAQQSTYKAASRKISMTPPSFRCSYGTRAKLWPKPFQNVFFMKIRDADIS